MIAVSINKVTSQPDWSNVVILCFSYRTNDGMVYQLRVNKTQNMKKLS
jgi:hypothetical protein